MSPDHPACDLPGLPRDDSGPVFKAPWQAQAFALALALHERGAFTWPEWAAALTAAIRRAQAAGDPDTGDTYYQHWLDALETWSSTRAWPMPSACTRWNMPGKPPPNARRTGSRSS
jgi:nitrile hydratase accessory protein